MLLPQAKIKLFSSSTIMPGLTSGFIPSKYLENYFSKFLTLERSKSVQEYWLRIQTFSGLNSVYFCSLYLP